MSGRPAPLKKKTLEGALYTRRTETTAKLLELFPLTPEELIERCKIEEKDDEGYVPSECLVYFVRQSRGSSGLRFEDLYRILASRILRSLPNEETQAGGLSLRRSDLKNKVFDRFIALLVKDRTEYEERLDFFEVRFDKTLRYFRLDALSQVRRAENRSAVLDLDESTGETPLEIETATGNADPFSTEALSKLDYRSRLDAAIETLPDSQRRIIELWIQKIPFDSSEPGKVTIANTLKKSDKTVRTHFQKARKALRKILSEGENP
jgi:hypothetical protein